MTDTEHNKDIIDVEDAFDGAMAEVAPDGLPVEDDIRVGVEQEPQAEAEDTDKDSNDSPLPQERHSQEEQEPRQEIQQPRYREREPEQEDQISDLTESELTTLAEHDESDGTSHLETYLRYKMDRRELSRHEITALKRLDDEKETDLYGEYREKAVERRILNRLQPVVKPVAEAAQREQMQRYLAYQREVDKSNEVEFGDKYKDLEKKSSDPKYIEKVLNQSHMAQLIIQLHESGNKAMAHKLLLREINIHDISAERDKKDGKKQKSVPADIGGSGSRSKIDRSDSIESAFDAALAEMR